MRLRLPLKALTFCLLVLSTTAAAQAPQAKQEAKARKGLERKALALLDETLKGAQALKVAENRAAVRTQAADILWPHDEKRARALFRAAAADLAAVKSTDPNRRRKAFGNSSLLRQGFVYIVAARDAQLALKLLHDSRPASEAGSNAPAGATDSELKTEQWLRRLAAESDPQNALRLAEEELSKGFTFEGLAQLQRLCLKDPKTATKLAGKIVQRLRGETPDGGHKAWGPAIYLLRGVLQSKPGGEPRYYNLPGPPSPDPAWPKSLVIVMEEADVRELADLIVAAVLKDSYTNGVHGMMVVSIRALIPELEKLVPARAMQLNLRLAEMDNLLDPRARALAQYSTILRRPPEVILEKAAQAPAETGKYFYRAAAAKFFGAGEVERARTVVNENLSGEEREQMLAHLDDAEVARAVEQGKPDDARAAVSRIIRSNERRATALAKVATAYAAKGDKKRAAVLLEEARGLMRLQLANAREFNALLNIARDYALVEPAKTFELIDSLIDLVQAHERMSAALRPERPHSEKRAAWDRLFNPQGEINIPMNGSSTWGGTYLSFLKVLPELARVDFDRTRQMADRFNPNELRLVARLVIARSVLSDRLDLVADTPAATSITGSEGAAGSNSELLQRRSNGCDGIAVETFQELIDLGVTEQDIFYPNFLKRLFGWETGV
jgi:hypothetical protein